jgi:hypothetical protein
MNYLFNKIEELSDDEYLPSNEDILKAPLRTIRYDSVTFNMEGAMIRIYDVVGQLNERYNWNKDMKYIESCVFCVSFVDFDKPMFEDHSILPIYNSLKLFEQISNDDKFNQSSLFLICNKIDIFKEKVEKIHSFIQNFTEFQDDRHNAQLCGDFLVQKFIERIGPNNPDYSIIPFKIVALKF